MVNGICVIVASALQKLTIFCNNGKAVSGPVSTRAAGNAEIGVTAECRRGMNSVRAYGKNGMLDAHSIAIQGPGAGPVKGYVRQI